MYPITSINIEEVWLWMNSMRSGVNLSLDKSLWWSHECPGLKCQEMSILTRKVSDSSQEIQGGKKKGIGAMARFHNFSLIFDKIYLVHGQICPVLWLNIIIAIAKALVAMPGFIPWKAVFKFILCSSVSI